MEEPIYRTLAPRENVSFEIAVGPAETDALSRAIVDGSFKFSPSFRLLFQWMRPGQAVLDLGGHIGTFSLSAAALGCRVLAVEASPLNAALFRAGIERNGLDVDLVQAAVSDAPGTVEFVQGGPYGYVVSGPSEFDLIKVPALTVDALLAEHGWDRVDWIKLDIEGSEIAALRGMSALLSRPDAPLIMVESNAHTLDFFGWCPNDLFAALEEYGYRIYMVEDGHVEPVRADHLQLECVADCIAARDLPPLPEGWRVQEIVSSEELASRIASLAAHPHEHYRAHLASTLACAGDELLGDWRVRLALDRLADDSHPDVRAAAAWWVGRRGSVPVHNPEPGALPQEASVEAPDLDTETLMRQIRDQIRTRRAEALSRGLDFEAYAEGLYPIPPDAVFSRDVYESVRYAGQGWDKTRVEMLLTENRLPLVGRLVQRLRAALHELVLFYVNRQAARQIHYNEQTARALAALVRDLEHEVAELRARLAVLESRDEWKS